LVRVRLVTRGANLSVAGKPPRRSAGCLLFSARQLSHSSLFDFNSALQRDSSGFHHHVVIDNFTAVDKRGHLFD